MLRMGRVLEGAFVGVWSVLNALQGIWICFYIQTSVDPNPRNGANVTHKRWLAFKITMLMVGIVITFVNAHICRIAITRDVVRHRGYQSLSGKPHWSTRRILFYIFVAAPVTIWFFCMPAFGGFIVMPFAQNWAWDHRCDSFPMYAILDARGYKDSASTPSVARFYQAGSSQSLFTYGITSDPTKLFWTFRIHSFDIPQSSIPLDRLPTLQKIQYAYTDNTLNGTCTLPTVPGNPTANSASCLSGVFNPNDFLSFNLTSTVPLNNATSFSTTASTSTHLRIIDKEWAFDTLDAPSLIMDTVDPATNSLQQMVLRTAVTKYADCSQLKVCIAGVAGREGSLVGAEVLAPMGVIFTRQLPYALQCTSGKRKKVA